MVEHDADEVFLFERALTKCGVENPVRTVSTADDARSYLSGDGVFANRELFPLPALIILDLDMPAYTACELLDWIRSRWQFDSVPVVALSDGIPDPQLQRLFDRGINAFFHKRMDVVETALLIRDTEFLDEVVELRRDAQPD